MWDLDCVVNFKRLLKLKQILPTTPSDGGRKIVNNVFKRFMN